MSEKHDPAIKALRQLRKLSIFSTIMSTEILFIEFVDEIHCNGSIYLALGMVVIALLVAIFIVIGVWEVASVLADKGGVK